MLLELRREMRLTVDRAAEGDFVLEAAGPSDRLPFRALEDRSHFLWVYTELFTRLGVRLPFTEFQREVLSRCQVAASQVHLNGWGFLRTFERCFRGNVAASKPFSVEGEEGAREDPAADLRQKRQQRKAVEASAEEAVLGGDSAWKHNVNPIDCAFPPDYNFRASLDVGLTNDPIREILGPLVPEQLLRTAQFLACQLTACLQVGVENTFVATVQLEKELAATKDQVDVLTTKRDSALAVPLLHAKIKSLSEELERAEGERLSAFERMKEVKEGAKTALDEGEAATVHWRGEWKSLAEETGEMVQETFEILMDQVCHLNPAIDYSMITLDTRWDPKAKRIYNPEAEVQGEPEPVAVDRPEPVVEEQPEVQPEHRVEDVVAGEGGGCPI
ncbi:hypothetical protein PIB30_061343 [Stylosanthes scabra]|uniref:Uncharacterized protein n=1 Tax=Stylosanthes scabra TaxID=79078 RepID=A0ABU6ZJH2_9FABA|nr:hypothetical protein [Stylosanthes scabra]